jgi:hypothetical protein
VKAEAAEANGEEPQAPEQVPQKAAKAGGDEQAAVAKKLAKLKPDERTDYETRAAAKNQTLEEYVLRRIQKKAKKHETEDVGTTEPVEAADSVANPSMFFSDLGGDPHLINMNLPLAGKPPRNRSQRRALEPLEKKKKKKSKPAAPTKLSSASRSACARPRVTTRRSSTT